MRSVHVTAPAKVNLTLAITGRRPDGYHDLLSVAATVAWGDHLVLTAADDDELRTDHPAVPTGPENLVWKAVALWRQLTGDRRCWRIELRKRIPVGAGLGGGSSDAMAILRALVAYTRRQLPRGVVAAWAAQLGADCAVCDQRGPMLMRGRGEVLSRAPDGFCRWLAGRRVLLFMPEFSIPTPWAYQTVANQGVYDEAAMAERELAAWLATPDEAPWPGNRFLEAVGTKYPALPTLCAQLQTADVGPVGLSGSGAACFCLPKNAAAESRARDLLENAWGKQAFCIATRFHIT